MDGTTGTERRRLVAGVAASICSLFGSGPIVEEAEAALTTDPVDDGVLDEVNRVRRAHGLRPLRHSVGLDRAATARSRDMALRGYFSHTVPGTGWFSARVLPSYAAPGFRTWRLGENLFWSVRPRPSSYVVRAWLNSPPHRRLLLQPDWNDAGIGAVRTTSAPGYFGGRSVTIVTAEFGKLGR